MFARPTGVTDPSGVEAAAARHICCTAGKKHPTSVCDLPVITCLLTRANPVTGLGQFPAITDAPLEAIIGSCLGFSFFCQKRGRRLSSCWAAEPLCVADRDNKCTIPL